MTDSVDGVTEYTYDAQGQLLTETVTPIGGEAKLVNAMTYDNYGNILSKITNGATKTYEYNCTWKDKLTAVDGVPIVYDNLGNPISYLGHNLTWEKGRQLKKFTKADGTVIQYTYNANGIRTSKTIGGVKHTYFLDGTKILKETWGDCTLIPLYDNEDSVCGIIYDDAAYYFHKNLQGDVIEIRSAYGSLVASYTYDAWGKVISITNENGLDVTDNAAHVANANPFRYRGYYYDAEIEMYYLQSRYYDPSVARFINADENNYIVNLEYTNLFSYCYNNPTNNIDISGELGIPWRLKIALVAGIASGFYEMVKFTKANFGRYITTKEILIGWGKAFALGFIRGFLVGLLSTVSSAVRYGLVGGTIYLLVGITGGTVKNTGQAFTAFMNGWTVGVIACGISALFTKYSCASASSSATATENQNLWQFAVETILGILGDYILRW